MVEAIIPSVAPPAVAAKNNLRKEMLRRRDAVLAPARAEASAKIRSHVAALPEVSSAHAIAAFWPIRSEADLRPLLLDWYEAGKTVALPVMAGCSLIFRRWQPGCAMAEKAFGVSEPGADCPEVKPQILLVPIAAFDRSGGRLGYGKGFYDRAIAALPGAGRGMTIGVAFAMQEVVSVPLEPHDRPLGVVVTETEIVRI